MSNPKTLVVTVKDFISPSDLEPLKSVSDVTYMEKERVSEGELSSMIAGYDYLMLEYDAVKHLGETFYSNPNARKLKGISTDITGMSWANPEMAKKYGITLMNVPNYCTESVAESILCEVLLHSRKIHEAYKDMIKGGEPKERRGINLRGRTVGIVGLGSIGMRTAELLRSLGMDVIAWNRTPKTVPGVKMMPTIKELFSKSDVVCLGLKTVAAGNSPTTGIISREVLGASRKGLILVNLAGLELVDHDALYDEITAGKISGYSFTREEKAKALKVASLDCVSMPPANAWLSDESLNELRKIWVGNIVSAINGHPQNVVKD